MSLLGRAWVESPSYEVIGRGTSPAYEIRKYPSLLVAKTFVPRNVPNFSYSLGFQTLANFIFGGNKAVDKEGPEKISMTTPVGHVETGDGVWMSFVMPSKWTKDTLPVPVDDDVKIEEQPEMVMAAVEFSGSVYQDTVDQQHALLRSALERDGVKIVTDAKLRLHQYDPPWVPPFLRKNEVLLPVQV